MLKQDKERIVKELAERLRSTETLIVADYRGLTMPEIDELRGKLLESGARFSVVKNTLTKRAAEEAGAQKLLELIEGPTAIAFLEAEADPAAAAKILNDVAKTNDVLVIRGGILEGDAVSDAEIKRLATLPSAEVLRAQLAGAVFGPLTTVVGLFTAPMRDLVGILDARINQLREQGEGEETPAAEEPQADAEPTTAAQSEVEPQAEAEAQETTTEPDSAEGDQPSDDQTEEGRPAAEKPAPAAESEVEPQAEADAQQEESPEEPTTEEPQEEASNGED